MTTATLATRSMDPDPTPPTNPDRRPRARHLKPLLTCDSCGKHTPIDRTAPSKLRGWLLGDRGLFCPTCGIRRKRTTDNNEGGSK